MVFAMLAPSTGFAQSREQDEVERQVKRDEREHEEENENEDLEW